jgi:sortase A
MRGHRTRAFASTILIGSGIVLLFLGSRDYLESHLGQSEAAHQFEELLPASRPSSPSSLPPPLVPATGSTIAKLIIPRLASELYVVEGDGAGELRRGPGHLSGTALPGQNGNCVIAGHRDTHFRILQNIRRGDDIVLETTSGKFLYRVRTTRIVSPKNTEALQPTAKPELNLITCYPFYYVGSAPKRFVVEAQLAGRVTKNDTAMSPSPGAQRGPRVLTSETGAPTS